MSLWCRDHPPRLAACPTAPPAPAACVGRASTCSLRAVPRMSRAADGPSRLERGEPCTPPPPSALTWELACGWMLRPELSAAQRSLLLPSGEAMPVRAPGAGPAGREGPLGRQDALPQVGTVWWLSTPSIGVGVSSPPGLGPSLAGPAAPSPLAALMVLLAAHRDGGERAPPPSPRGRYL